MIRKLTIFFREYIFYLSIITIIIGFIILFFGVFGILFNKLPIDPMNITDKIITWCPYILIIGFIILIGSMLF